MIETRISLASTPSEKATILVAAIEYQIKNSPEKFQVHHPGAAPTIPDDCSIGSLDSPEVDLTECTNIQYAMKDGVHGVSYTGNLEEQGWTPVVGRRRRRSVPDFVKDNFHLIIQSTIEGQMLNQNQMKKL